MNGGKMSLPLNHSKNEEIFSNRSYLLGIIRQYAMQA